MPYNITSLFINSAGKTLSKKASQYKRHKSVFILKNESDIPEKDKGFDVIACWHSLKARLDCGLWILDSVLKKNYQTKDPKKL